MGLAVDESPQTPPPGTGRSFAPSSTACRSFHNRRDHWSEVLPVPPPEAPVPRGFHSYGLNSQMLFIRPTLAWNPGLAPSLAKLVASYSATNKFATCTCTERLYSLGTAALSVVGAGPALFRALRGAGLSSYLQFLEKRSPWCAQTLRPRSTPYSCWTEGILPAGSMVPRVSALLTGLYKQLGNLHLLRRESMLRSACNRETPTQEILRQAPLVSSPSEI